MQRGVRRLTELGIDRTSYHVHAASGPDLPELDGYTFDFIFSFSVLQYLDASDFDMVCRRLAGLLADGGICILTYSEPGDQSALRRKGMHFYDATAYRNAFPADRFTIEHDRIPFAAGAGGKVLVIQKRALT